MSSAQEYAAKKAAAMEKAAGIRAAREERMKQAKQAPRVLEELRIDPSDGQAYTKRSFLDEYGGTAEWDAAPVNTWLNQRPAERGANGSYRVCGWRTCVFRQLCRHDGR